MRVSFLIDEDFANYKKTSLFIGTSSCDGKCWVELGLPKETCQNSSLYCSGIKNIDDEILIRRYLNNPLSKAIVIGGLEPFQDPIELYTFVRVARRFTNDDIVIYSGYNKSEILGQIDNLSKFPNIIIKYGRFIPNQISKYDNILGVELVSENQYAEKIS